MKIKYTIYYPDKDGGIIKGECEGIKFVGNFITLITRDREITTNLPCDIVVYKIA